MCPDRRLRMFRALVFVSCLALFLAHSSREVDKYLTGLTSTSIRSYDDKELSFPIIVVCHKLPFKSGKPIMTKEDYQELVYEFEDILDADRFFPSLGTGNLTVKVLDSLWYGRCYGLEYNNISVLDWVTIGIKRVEDVNIAIMEKGQEVCVELGICPDPYPIIEPESAIVEFWLSAKRKIRPKGSCNKSSNFDYYSCLEEAVVREASNLLPCALPYHNFIVNGTFLARTGLKPCQGREELTKAIMDSMNLNNALIRNPEGFGCQKACQRWIFEYERRNYDNQAITNVMGSNFDSWQYTIWMTFLTGTIEMVEEYQVNDLTRIVASLGGSLGLFLGFSCFDCLVMALKAMHNNNNNNNGKTKSHDVEVEVNERELSLALMRNKTYV